MSSRKKINGSITKSGLSVSQRHASDECRSEVSFSQENASDETKSHELASDEASDLSSLSRSFLKGSNVLEGTEFVFDEAIQDQCTSLCLTENRNTEATHKCVLCAEYFCETCLKFHDLYNKNLGTNIFRLDGCKTKQLPAQNVLSTKKELNINATISTSKSTTFIKSTTVSPKAGSVFSQISTKSSSASSSTKLLPVAANSSSPVSKRPQKEHIEMCEIHNRMLDMYCRLHKFSGCSICMKLEHKSCKDITPRLVQSQYSRSKASTSSKASRTNTSSLISSRSAAHLYVASGSKTVNISLTSDKHQTCNVCDMCQLQDGRILILDEINCNIKLIDASYTVANICELCSRPFGVCSVNSDEAAVALYKTIQIVQTSQKLTTTRKIDLKLNCQGIVFSKDNYYVADGYTRIHVYTSSGDHLTTFEMDKSGENRYYEIEHMALSHEGSRIILVHNHNDIICMDIASGHIIWKIRTEEETSGYIGICAKNDNSIFFVCKNQTNEVVQIGHDGTLSGTLLSESDGLKWPSSACVDHITNMIIIGMDTCNELLIFNLNVNV